MGTLTRFGDHSGYLLDTHAFLWASQDKDRLGLLAKSIIEDVTSKLFLSSISAYEVTNKYRLGNLDSYGFLISNYAEIARKLGVIDLPVALAHTYQAGTFEWEHRDPFDRILAAQAALENLVIITDDANLKAAPWFETVW